MDIRTTHILSAQLRTGDAVGQHTFDLARVLRRHGVDVRIFQNFPEAPLPDDIAAMTTQADYATYHPTADLTIVQYAIWFPLAERLRDAPGAAIFWYHGVTPPALWGSGVGLEMLEMSQLRTDIAWYAHLAVADSPFVAGELYETCRYPQAQIQVCPLMVDTAAFGQPPDRAEVAALRTRWQLADNPVLLYIGRIVGNKRIDLAIRALAHLQPTHPHARLVVVGDHTTDPAAREQKTRLAALADELAVAEKIVFTGRVPSVKPYLDLADMLVLPSQHEGFGVPVVEAMAAGVPAVVSASGSLPWLVEADQGPANPGAGLLFTPGDAADLARQLARLLDDPDLRAEMIRRGQARLAAFMPETFEQNVIRVVDEAVARSRQGPPPAGSEPRFPLYIYSDVALRDYAVRSGAPVVGPLIEWVRINSTTHVKEAYLDRIVERQVNYNKMLATEVGRLQAEVRRLRAEVERLRGQTPAAPK
jgi:glycosyltransferase involved in cell wall biosynthesis